MTTKPPLLAPGEPTAGWLVLIGGGEFSFGETEEIDRFLISKMPAQNRRIAFLPTASGSTEYAQHLGTYFARLESRLEVINVPMYRGRDVRREKNLAMLREAGMIYVGGGVLSRVVGALRDTPASAVIMESLGRGCVVAAIGAAASAAGSVVAGFLASSVTSGLGWIPATAIEAGFVAAEDAHLRQLASLPDVSLAIGIPRSTAVAIDPDRRVQILGAGDVMVIRKN